ncbi:MAG: hypothetical protein RBS35_00860 [Azonexus sp.]|jgi:hypothetical protein|nr:hypothetical protein [Azonexus sp.]
MTLNFSLPSFTRRQAMLALAVFAFSLLLAASAQAVDLDALASLGGPLGSALTQLDSLSEGMKALVGFLAFAVAFITLAALRNMGPIMLFIGVAIFGAVGLPIAGAILGATI